MVFGQGGSIWSLLGEENEGDGVLYDNQVDIVYEFDTIGEQNEGVNITVGSSGNPIFNTVYEEVKNFSVRTVLLIVILLIVFRKFIF